jgi:DNA-binding response OmpR family regulator
MTRGERSLVVVEDDDQIAGSLQGALEAAGYRVQRVATVAEAERVLWSADVALVNVTLPDGDGVELCRRNKQRSPHVPLIVITAQCDEVSIVDALDAGADDCVAVPFRVDELIARIRAHLRRTEAAVTESDGVRMDIVARLAWHRGDPLLLTAREFDLLVYLVRRAGLVVRRRDVLCDVWDVHWKGSTRTLDFYISALRAKLAEPGNRGDLIETITGVGYRFGRSPATVGVLRSDSRRHGR